jgi:hypothetical protein
MKEPRNVAGKKMARGKKLPLGKNWRLVTPSRSRLKASLVGTFSAKGERFAVFRIVDQRK